jgi:uncharacterized protein (DUF885 family)
VISADPFLLPTKKFPAGISPAEQQRLSKAINDAVVNEVLPAYKPFAAFIAADYAPHGRTTLSVASLPGGKERFEGWALYAEQLGKEVGFYQDPVSDYGRLSSELFRAVRLVVDTGLHSEDWTRDQVVAFFRQSGAVDEPTIQAETDRYISWPAQALSYKLGQLKFRELRGRAQKALGPKFDIRTFHDEMISGGVLPLDLLDSRTNSWIQEQKWGVKATAAN